MVRLAVGAGAYGALWLDRDLIVRRRLGDLVAFAHIDRPVSDSVLALLGLEARLDRLRAEPGSFLHLSNIAVRGLSGDQPRLRITIHWSEPLQQSVVLINRVAAGDTRDAALEDEIRKRRIADEALSRVNQQLEEFAYIISHDLKEPMRSVRYLSEDIASALDGAAPDLAAVRRRSIEIVAQARRMSAMLVDLLDYSRIGREHVPPEAVALGDLVDDIARSLKSRPGIVVAAEDAMPIIRTLRVPLDIALRNLVANGVKHHDRAQGRVTVSAAEAPDHVVIGVSDDGPGIDPQWHEAIFMPFRKLESDRDVESTGIGLALVRRAVESVGGRIQVHSDPTRQRGTRFEIWWPRYPDSA